MSAMLIARSEVTWITPGPEAILAADPDARTLPDADAAGDLAAHDRRAQALGEHHRAVTRRSQRSAWS